MKKSRLVVYCSTCKKRLERTPFRINRAKSLFCDNKCYGKYRSMQFIGKKSPRWKYSSHTKLICNYCGKKYEEIIQRKERSKFCSRKCLNDWMSENMSNENSVHWKGGKSSKRREEGYYNRQYKSWRKAVFERDNYTCQFCYERGCYLEAHHIKPWKEYPELRFDINNGVTLCKECHNIEGLHKKG